MQVESRQPGKRMTRRRPTSGEAASMAQNEEDTRHAGHDMVQCRASCQGRSGTEGEKEGQQERGVVIYIYIYIYRKGECRASCSEGGGAQGRGVGQSTRGKDGTERAKEGREAEGTRQGHRGGQMANDRGAGEPRGLQCTVRATARGTGAPGKEGTKHIVV